MSWTDWLWSTGVTWLSSTGLSMASILAVLYFFRDTLVVPFLSKSFDAKLETKLERIRSEHRKSEEAFSADLRAKQAEIDSLRGAALTGLTSRHIALDKRRIEAVEKTWASFISARRFSGFAHIMTMIKFEAAAEATERDDTVREKFERFFKPFQLETFAQDQAADSEMPFLTPQAWALYNAYRMIIAVTIVQAHVIRFGVGTKMMKEQPFADVVIPVLPHRKAFIEKFGFAAGPHLLSEIEGLLLSELRTMLTGHESDKQSALQAQELLRYTSALGPAPVSANSIPEGFRQEPPDAGV
ncbi:hypothetical protein [Taklimakanibacter deserti]|uniref:hypothetical protein n=1 Tax=Taklimakanibacter deserti TaxID=2267839 RepID=UPI000E6488DC